MKKVLCINCGKFEKYQIRYEEKSITFKDLEVHYKEKIAYCEKCGQIVDVPGLWDHNLLSIQKEYCKLKRIKRVNKEIK